MRITSRLDLLNCSSGVENWRRGVTCRNCDPPARGDLGEQSHSSRAQSQTSGLFYFFAIHSFRFVWQSECI
jgi:hypothetical protein